MILSIGDVLICPWMNDPKPHLIVYISPSAAHDGYQIQLDNGDIKYLSRHYLESEYVTIIPAKDLTPIMRLIYDIT